MGGMTNTQPDDENGPGPIDIGLIDRNPPTLAIMRKSFLALGHRATIRWTAQGPQEITSDHLEPALDILAFNMGTVAFSDMMPICTGHSLPSHIIGVSIDPRRTPQIELTEVVPSARLGEGHQIVRNALAHVLAGTSPLLEARPDALSPRESEIMGMYASGLTTRSIARRLSLGETTVKTYARRAFIKLDAANRASAVAILARNGGLLPGR